MAVQPAERAEPGTGGDILYPGGAKVGGVGDVGIFFRPILFLILCSQIFCLLSILIYTLYW